jgi:protein O-mannosyl-transferase
MNQDESAPVPANPSAERLNRRRTTLGGAVIALAVLAAYANSLHGPFVFDDLTSIPENPTIRHLAAVGQVLSPPSVAGTSVAGRPLVNLSFAVNYAFGGLDVVGYHALNIVIHLLAGLTLFGIVRRTLVRFLAPGSDPASAPRGPIAAGAALDRKAEQVPLLLAVTVALLWSLHPLQTESVAFVVQRTESLMGLFYLLTLYCFIRHAEEKPTGAIVWAGLSILACLLGMATKEVMVTAPLLVWLYDRTFVSGSFREAWCRHRRYYAGLAATWLLLGYLVVNAGGRRGTAAGFGLGIDAWTYALTQCQAVLLYLKLAVWPHPLVVDYGTGVVHGLGEVTPHAIALLFLLAGTAIALWRRPVLGFLGAWFFVILAPSSSVIPLVTQTVAEHRIYLSLAAVITCAVAGAYLLAGRTAIYVSLVLAAGAGWFTALRNGDYRSGIALWSDTVAKAPTNPRAHNNLGYVLDLGGRTAEAIAQYQQALRLQPDYVDARNNLGAALMTTPGRMDDAIAQYREALRLKPDYPGVHYNLGNALLKIPGQMDEAVAHLQEALRRDPDFADAHRSLGDAWAKMPGQLEKAVAEFKEALRLRPDYVDARINLGSALARMPGRISEAMTEFEAAARQNLAQPGVHLNLGHALLTVPGRVNDAIAQLQEALRLKPDYPEAHLELGNAWAAVPGRLDDAIAQFREALRVKPDYPEAHFNLGNAWATVPGRMNDTIAEYQEALRLRPDYADAHVNLGNALCAQGRFAEAVAQYQEALRLQPDHVDAHFNLAVALLNLPGRAREAQPHVEAVLRLQPGNDDARQLLASIRASLP